MLGSHGIRTDLALEATERFTEENVEVRGVEVTEDYNEEKDIRTTVVKITTENGARTMGRPQGNYITIEAPGLSMSDTMLTAYDYSTAKLMDESGVDAILVGDSLGNVILGWNHELNAFLISFA